MLLRKYQLRYIFLLVLAVATLLLTILLSEESSLFRTRVFSGSFASAGSFVEPADNYQRDGNSLAFGCEANGVVSTPHPEDESHLFKTLRKLGAGASQLVNRWMKKQEAGKAIEAAALEEDLENHDRKFKQPLVASCTYFDDENGLFEPSTPLPRYIVTGGAGFVGSHLVKALRKQGVSASQIKVVDNLWRGRMDNLQDEQGRWVLHPVRDFCAMDLRNEKDTLRYLRGADTIYHLADVVAGVDYVFKHQEQVFHDNILINSYTIKASKENGIPNFIYVGTACSFPKHLQMGPGIHALRENQTYPAEPESGYGWSKLMGEYEAELAKLPGVFNVGMLRFHNVYGPRSDFSPKSGQAIPSLIRKALNYPEEPYIVWGSGKQYRDFVYIDDVVDALLLLRKKGMNMGVIQVGSGEATTVAELASVVSNVVGRITGKTIPIEFDTCKPEGDRGRIAVNDRAKGILGWNAKITLRKGIETTVAWMRSQMKKKTTLVIVTGQARGSDYAWKSLFKNLIEPYNAHLATFFTNASPNTILQGNAQFVWTVPEVDDWGVFFDQASRLCNTEEHVKDYMKLCDLKYQFLGGIKGCDHPASAGILLAFRWLVAQKILTLSLWKQYDYFIFTRADQVYLCPHFPLEKLDVGRGYVPFGEEYSGFTDRHLIAPSNIFFKMVNITQNLVCEPDFYKEVLAKRHPDLNLEQAQLLMWNSLSLPVNQFPRQFFTVKLPTDPTRWSKGELNEYIPPETGLLVKYAGELAGAMEYCETKSVPDVLKEIHGYQVGMRMV